MTVQRHEPADRRPARPLRDRLASRRGRDGRGLPGEGREARKRDVAIKVLPEALARDPDALARFEREARAVAASPSEHPVDLRLRIHDGIPYAVMELLEGETLRQKLAAGSDPAAKVIDTATQIARGLAAAHEKGIVHRDLKPENLFVTKDGHVKILDFGLARQIALPADAGDTKSPTLARSTEAGVVFGTVAYMSPEQVRGLPVDHRTDIFAFGSVLYEMVSGRRPFTGEIHGRDDARDPARRAVGAPAARTGIRTGTTRLVATCLAKKPGSAGKAPRPRPGALLDRPQERGVGLGEPAPPDRAWLPWTTAVLAAAIAVFRGLRGKAPALARRRHPLLDAASGEDDVRSQRRPAFPRVQPRRPHDCPAGSSEGRAVLWLWSVADETAIRLADTDGAIVPVLVPGRALRGVLRGRQAEEDRRIGRSAQVLCEAPFGKPEPGARTA